MGIDREQLQNGFDVIKEYKRKNRQENDFKRRLRDYESEDSKKISTNASNREGHTKENRIIRSTGRSR